MRHLRVPKPLAQSLLELLRENGWQAVGYKVKDDDGHILVPLSHHFEEKSEHIPPELQIIDVEGEERVVMPRHYREYLKEWLPEETVTTHWENWTDSYDRMGDLIIVKVSDSVEQYDQQMGLALLTRHSFARLVLRDEGVKGEWRIRGLKPLAVRIVGAGKEELLTADEVADTYPTKTDELFDSRTMVIEHGARLFVDPAKAYFSPRLATDRQWVVESALELKKRIGRSLRIVDPYAGVGPTLVPLLRQEGLVSSLLANDLNPDAVTLLSENINHHLPHAGEESRLNSVTLDSENINHHLRTNKQIAIFPKGAESISEGVAITSNEDARILPTINAYKNSFDLLLVNLPHSSLDHLPSLLPLLSIENESMVIGWSILEDSAAEVAAEALREVLAGWGVKEFLFDKGRQYSPSQSRYRWRILLSFY